MLQLKLACHPSPSLSLWRLGTVLVESGYYHTQPHLPAPRGLPPVYGKSNKNMNVLSAVSVQFKSLSPIYFSRLAPHWFRYWHVARLQWHHYLNQWLFIVNWTITHKFQWNLDEYTKYTSFYKKKCTQMREKGRAANHQSAWLMETMVNPKVTVYKKHSPRLGCYSL